jgi:hypothetical protein
MRVTSLSAGSHRSGARLSFILSDASEAVEAKTIRVRDIQLVDVEFLLQGHSWLKFTFF